jgi:hypothetical protein
MNDQALPSPQQRIAELEEQLDALHDRNLHLEFRLRQRIAENEDHEKDYLAVWKALRPRHGVSFMQAHENIVQAVQRLVNEIPTLQAVLAHSHVEAKARNEALANEHSRGFIAAISLLSSREDVEAAALREMVHFVGGEAAIRALADAVQLIRLKDAGLISKS